MKKIASSLGLILLAALTAAAPGIIYAAKPKAAAEEQKYHIHDEETFRAVAKSFHWIPFNDPRLEFDILLPKDWTPVSTVQTEVIPDLRRKVPGDIARFRSPIIGTRHATVVIQSVTLEHEIEAKDWLKNFIFLSGWSLQGEIIPAGEKRASASFISVAEDKSEYNYATVQINGNAAVIAIFSNPLAMRDYLAFLREKTINSFRMILTSEDTVEQHKSFIFTDALKFVYPESWAVYYPDLADTYNQSVQFHNEAPGRRTEGMIRLLAVKRLPATSLMKEVEKLRKYFDEFLGIEFKSMASSAAAPVYDRFLFSRQEIYHAVFKQKEGEEKSKRKADQELRFVALGDKEWYIFAFLLTPAEKENLYTWARNVRTFDLMLRRLR